ncbi:MAG: IPT/TIG domain-containing protein [Dehalococcoidia bacterium]|nr:IPT/TIG domain-containing protein [Dehalococcoidia bacterium]
MKTLVRTRHPSAGIRWTLYAGVLLAAVLAMTGAPAAHAAGEPTICTISPASGSAAGGTAVKIEGNNFASATSVTFGGVPATSWTLHGSGWDTCGSDGTYIVAVAPAGTPGSSVLVRVTNVSGPSTSQVYFTYNATAAVPVVTDVSPDSGPTAGGTTVSISGAGFTGTTAVMFGGIASSSWTVVSDSLITAVSPANVPGTVNVRVTTGAGTSAANVASEFTYSATLPGVTGLSPAFGPPAGGNAVIITGFNLTSATVVRFDGIAASFVVSSSTSLTAIAPAHAAGSVAVQVQTPSGISSISSASTYIYTSDAVVVTTVDPDTGPIAGGNDVTIYGYGFTGATAVKFGALSAISYTILNDTTIVAYAPAQSAGSVYVRVTAGGFTSAATTASTYTYTGIGPVISSIVPFSGPVTGGTSVTIYGAGFTGAYAVAFGSYAATSFTVIDSGTIIAVAPAQPAGAVYIRVTTLLGTSALNAASLFTYTGSGPVVTSVSPASGTVTGGTVVTITGTGFTGATSVSFGGTAASSYTVISANSITAIAPAHSAGAVYIVVTTGAGGSPQVAASQFTFTGTAGTVSYTLTFRWTLLTWVGIDGISVDAAVKGLESPDVAATNDVSGRVTAIFLWDSVNQKWQAWFPNASNIPGANDFSTFRQGRAYFIAINGSGSTTWVVIAG